MSAVRNLIINGTLTNTVTGGVGIAANLYVGGNISGFSSGSSSGLVSNNQAYFVDGLNQGYVQQLSTELTLVSSGNDIALAANNYLVFNNDPSRNQLTAYNERHTINPIEFHALNGYDVVKQTLSLQNVGITTTAIGGGKVFSNCLGTLFKGTLIRGVFTWLSATLASGCQFGIYKASTQSLVASTNSNIGTDLSGMCYFQLSSPYTVDETTVYYVSSLSTSAINGLHITHTSYNYGLATSVSSLSRRTLSTNATYTSLPSSLSAVASTGLNQNIFIGVYQNFLLNTDSSLLAYIPYDNTISGEEVWNYNKYFIDGSRSNNFIIDVSFATGASYNINTGNRIGNSCLNIKGRVTITHRINPGGISFNQDNFTVCLWFKSTTYSNTGRIFSMSPTGGGFMILQHFPTTISCNCDNTFLMDNAGGSINITANTWGHIAIVVNGPTMTYYVNGILRVTRTRVSQYGSPTTSLNSFINGSISANDFATDDFIDDVRFYNRSLNINEIQEIYNYRGVI